MSPSSSFRNFWNAGISYRFSILRDGNRVTTWIGIVLCIFRLESRTWRIDSGAMTAAARCAILAYNHAATVGTPGVFVRVDKKKIDKRPRGRNPPKTRSCGVDSLSLTSSQPISRMASIALDANAVPVKRIGVQKCETRMGKG